MFPVDYDNPVWDTPDRWAWQRFVPDHIREIWYTFSVEQKIALAEWAALDGLASRGLASREGE